MSGLGWFRGEWVKEHFSCSVKDPLPNSIPEQKGGGSSVFEPLARGGSFDCQQPIGGGSSYFKQE